MAKVGIYCDGFNFFYGLSTHFKSTGSCFYWLDLQQFYQALIFRKPYGSLDDQLVVAKHFTADPMSDERRARHRAYFDIFGKAGIVSVISGRHARKQRTCRANCKEQYWDFEEKETDVNLGIHIIRDAYESRFEKLILISSDSDFLPVLTMLRQSHPGILKVVLSPLGANKGYRLAQKADCHIKLKESDYSPYLLPDPVILGSGVRVPCPMKWHSRH